MRTTLLKSALFALAFGVAVPASAADLLPVSGIVNGISADGSKAVGNKAGTQDYNLRFNSYLYDVREKALDWLTTYDESDLLTSGKMVGVTDNGIIAGTMYNPDMRLPKGEVGPYRPGLQGVAYADAEELGTPLLSAAVWRNGKAYILGCGPHSIEEFDQLGDGTEGVGLSADGNLVFGNLIQSLFQVAPVKWTYNADKDEYEYSELQLGPGVVRGVINCVAGNGACGGFVRHNGVDKPAVWLADGTLVPISIPNGERDGYYWEVYAGAISPSGRYALVCASGNHNYLGIYDLESGDLTDIPVPDKTFEVAAYAITDNGTAYCSVTPSTNNYTPVLHIFNMGDGILVDFNYYLENVAAGVAGRFNSSNKQVVGVSADGSVIAGRYGTTDWSESWIIMLDKTESVSVPAPTGVNLFFSSVESLTLTWDEMKGVAENLEIVEFDVYIDNEYVKTVPASEAVDGKYRVTVEAVPGYYHTGYVVANARNKADNKIYPSPDSATGLAYVSGVTTLLGYEDFDNCPIDGNGDPRPVNDYWNSDVPYGNETGIIVWHLNIGNDYLNRTPIYATYSISEDPWSSRLTSRFHDASDAKEFYLDFLLKVRLLNEPDQILTSDFLDVEASVDGENWIIVKRICAADLLLGEWTNEHIDMGKDWAGKCFQVRFNAHGEGLGQLMWCVDNINFGDQLSGETPTGLSLIRPDNSTIRLSWHSTLGTHEVSHIYNSSYVTDYNLGDEGRPMIAAVKLTPEMLKPYVGQYISAISSFIYDDPSIESSNPTRAQAVVFDDKGKIAEGDIFSEFTEPVFSTGWLDDAVKIEAGKTYFAGVRIYDYNPQQTPIYYQAHPDCKPMVTDLYSSDEGATWRSVKQDLAEPIELGSENCIWPIRAHITPTPEYDPERQMDPTLTHYAVYRDGVAISDWCVYHSTPYYDDKSGAVKGSYAVRAYYSDGTISQLSEPLLIDISGIQGVESDVDVVLKQNGDVIVIEGEFDTADVIDMTGRRVLSTQKKVIATGALPTGVYLVSIHKDTDRSIFKVNVR